MLGIILICFCLIILQTSSRLPRSSVEDIITNISPKEASEGQVQAVIVVSPSTQYEIFGDVQHSISVNIAARGRNQFPSNIFVVFFPLEFYIREINTYGLNYTVGFQRQYGEIRFFLPETADLCKIEIEGTISSSSMLWRNSAPIAKIQIASFFGPTIVEHLVYQPPNSRILDIYVGVPYEDVLIESKSYIKVRQFTPTFSQEDVYKYYGAVILYESLEREAFSITAMILIFAIIGLSPYILDTELHSSLRRFTSQLMRIYHLIRKQVSSNRLLSAYILCAFLMISLSLFAGPDPRVKVFVLGSPSSSDQISQLVTNMHGIALTIEDTATEIETLASLGSLRAFIIADFIPISDDYARTYLYPALDNVHNILVIPSMANGFQEEVRQRFETGIIETELSDIPNVLAKISSRSNFFGLNIDVDTFLSVAKAEALLSFILVFLGLSYLAHRLIEVGCQPMLSGIGNSVIYVVAYYVVTQAVLMSSSILLSMPLGLHAVTSGSLDVTALGLLGLGGGSRPRMLSAFLGIFFGTLMAAKGGFKLDRFSLLAIILLFGIIALDPLTNGVLFHEFLLVFSVGPEFESTAESASLIKNFIGNVADIFGGWVTSSFAISRGIMLYYMGAIPFVLIPKLKRTSATILLLIGTAAIGLGGIRVAEMTPWKTLTNIFPGIATGLVIAMLFVLISMIEGAIRRLLRNN